MQITLDIRLNSAYSVVVRPSDVRPQLACALLRRTDRAPDKPFRVSLRDLALGLGIRHQTLSYYINQFREAGLIGTHSLLGIGTELTVLDREGLLRLAQGVKDGSGGRSATASLPERTGSGVIP